MQPNSWREFIKKHYKDQEYEGMTFGERMSRLTDRYNEIHTPKNSGEQPPKKQQPQAKTASSTTSNNNNVAKVLAQLQDRMTAAETAINVLMQCKVGSSGK